MLNVWPAQPDSTYMLLLALDLTWLKDYAIAVVDAFAKTEDPYN